MNNKKKDNFHQPVFFCSLISFVLILILFILALTLPPVECGNGYGDCYNNGTCIEELHACNCNYKYAGYWKCLPSGSITLRVNWFGVSAFILFFFTFVVFMEFLFYNSYNASLEARIESLEQEKKDG